MIMGTHAPLMPIDWIERDPFFLRRVEAAGSSTANGILVNGPSSTNPFRVTGDIDPSHTPRPGESADPSASAQRAGGGGALGSEMAVELDGQSLTVRGKSIPGDGTANNPYIIPWGLLVSAARTYQPDQGAEDLPSWTEALEGRFVMLTGFAFLPTFQTASQDMLLMLNEWDGCCIGVPPTPYDSIEVTLTEPASLLGRSNYVSVKGRLSTDPYLVRGWLVGLYLLDDAELVVHEN